jgi:hypothetical protein
LSKTIVSQMNTEGIASRHAWERTGRRTDFVDRSAARYLVVQRS